MSELLSKKNVNKWTDGLLIGISKVATENMLKPLIGDSTLMSGVIKVGAGSLIAGSKMGKVGNIVGQGMQIDGIEDLSLVIINKTNGLFGLLKSNNNATAETSATLL